MTPVPPLIDTHVHLWDLAHPELVWDWIDTDADHPILGRIDPVKMRGFDLGDLWAEARFSGVEAFVHVQAAIGSPDPVTETRWLTEMAVAHPRLRAIVGHIDLGHASAPSVLDRHRESPLFRGVRDFAVEPYLASGEVSPGMESSLRLLADAGLVLDLDCSYSNMAAAATLAGRHPGMPVVLEHIGFPRARDSAYFAAWRAAVRTLASAPNVVCKLSGLGMTDRLFTAESLRPWVETCLEAFGPQRCMFGSNWPLDRMCSSYDGLVAAVRSLLIELSPSELDAVTHRTAATVYGIDRPAA